MPTIIAPPFTGGITTTAGTGPFQITDPLAVPGGGGANYRPWSTVPDGSHVFISRADVGGANFEYGVADVSNVSGVVTLAWNPRTLTSAGGITPVSWPGGGAQTVYPIPDDKNSRNGGAEYAANAALFRGFIGLDSAATMPAYALGFVPAGAGVDGAWTGGTNGRVVRYASANTMADASNTDTVAQLRLSAWKTAAGYFVGPGLVTGLSGLTAGAIYYLGTSGAITTTAPAVTIGGSTKLVVVGVAPSTTSLFFNPQIVEQG